MPSIVPPRSRRDELLAALLERTKDPIHVRILTAYKNVGTVEAAEQEFSRVIHEIINET